MLQWEVCGTVICPCAIVIASDGKGGSELVVPQVKAAHVPRSTLNMWHRPGCVAAGEGPQSVRVLRVREEAAFFVAGAKKDLFVLKASPWLITAPA